MRLVEVAFPLPLDNTFTYEVPGGTEEIAVGQRVLAPFRSRTVTGYVVGLPARVGAFELKAIHAVLDDLPILTPELLALARHMAESLAAPFGEALQTLLPAGISRESRRRVSSTEKEGTPGDAEAARLLERIRRGKGLDWVATVRRHPPAGKILRRLEREGWVSIESVLRAERAKARAGKKPPADAVFDVAPRLELTAAQRRASERIGEAVRAGSYAPFLLHGITGSGKTEIYLHAAAGALQSGKGVLALVPEIALTPQFVGRFRARLGGEIAVLHSARSESERLTDWKRIRRGEARVVIGARSAVFAPLGGLGLVIVDEEHDPSYKQDRGLPYNGRDLAVFRARQAGAALVCGSATPSLETYHRALAGEFALLELSSRVTAHDLPGVRVIDLRGQVSRFGEKGIFSAELGEAIASRLERAEQSVLFLNRRGYAPIVFCSGCGSSLRCAQCSVTVTYHDREKAYLCHYCGIALPKETPCPECGKESLLRLGFGTEKVERELRFAFPDARIARMDRDAVRRKGGHESILRKMAKREIDILVGTQMVTKGLDLPFVSLVGVLLADQSLQFPDFRAAERTFQLLTQVVGRSGRGGMRGEAVIQTFQPEHYAVAAAAEQNYRKFFEREIVFRRELRYPPFASLARIELAGADADAVRTSAMWLAGQCRKANRESGRLEFLGPAPAPIRRIGGKTRYHLLIRSPRGSGASAFSKWLAGQAREPLAERKIALRLDVDPYHFL